MYAGHLAAAMAMKSQEPRAPTWALVLGVGFLDVLFGIFIVLGIERATMTPGHSPGFALDFIDWSHSFAASLFWAICFGLVFIRRGRTVAAWLGFAVFSHFLLDLPMHPGDLAAWPHSAQHMGFGLWTKLPTGWWFFELAFMAACFAIYLARARRDTRYGRHAIAACGFIVALHVVNSPWLAVGQ
jgi:hypothetical protein